MDEFELIERYFAGRGIRRDDVGLGIGDDAAVTHCVPGHELVIATDMLCEGTHFPPDTPAHALGHRCLAVNLSDLAAMGAEPMWCTLALSLPAAEPDWLGPFADGFFSLAEDFGVALIGGDTVRGPLAITVTVHGRVEKGQAIRRDGARDGDLLYVTGAPGLAAAGLRALQTGGEPAQPLPAGVRRFWYPEPRLAQGRALVGLATAMIDVSDGLRVDAARLLTASGLGAHMDVGRLPLAALEADDALELALDGGDDYELCFAVPAARETELARLAADWTVPVTRIGTACGGGEVTWFRSGRPCNTVGPSFAHFS